MLFDVFGFKKVYFKDIVGLHRLILGGFFFRTSADSSNLEIFPEKP